MGHIFSQEGLKIDPDEVKAVLEMPSPEDVEEIQRLKGFVNYLAKFLPRLANQMEPIRRLIRKPKSSNGQKNKRKHYKKSNA